MWTYGFFHLVFITTLSEKFRHRRHRNLSIREVKQLALKPVFKQVLGIYGADGSFYLHKTLWTGGILKLKFREFKKLACREIGDRVRFKGCALSNITLVCIPFKHYETNFFSVLVSCQDICCLFHSPTIKMIYFLIEWKYMTLIALHYGTMSLIL